MPDNLAYRSSGRKGRDPVVTRRSRDKAVAVLLAPRGDR